MLAGALFLPGPYQHPRPLMGMRWEQGQSTPFSSCRNALLLCGNNCRVFGRLFEQLGTGTGFLHELMQYGCIASWKACPFG